MISCKRFIAVLTIITFVIHLSYVLNPIMESNSEEDFTTIKKNSLVVNHINHDPIQILSDENFTDYDFPGNGTAVNPYRIENYEISTLDHYFIDNAIWVEQTTKHFIIQNCFVMANGVALVVSNVSANTAQIISNKVDDCSIGISFGRAEGIIVDNNYIANCETNGITAFYINQNATISNNVCNDYNREGIYVQDCHNITIKANDCSNGNYGLFLKNSDGLIEDNIFSRNAQDGIYTGPSDDEYPIYIRNNTCEFNDESGIFSWYVTEVENNNLNYNYNGLEVFGFTSKILNNTFRGNRIGADLDSMGLFSKNKCLKNGRTGLLLVDSVVFSDTNITNNIFYANHYGIELEGHIEQAVINNNLIQENDKWGISISEYVENIIIHHNTFLDNNPGGTSQCYDSERDNLWFDLDAEEGNYWSDWSGEGWYLIDGNDNADIYPLTEPLHNRYIDPIKNGFPFGILIPFGLIIPLIIVITVIVKYKKQTSS